jgi:hypothetical protein
MGRCITACGPSDVDCQFKCISVPSPNDKQVSCSPPYPLSTTPR